MQFTRVKPIYMHYSVLTDYCFDAIDKLIFVMKQVAQRELEILMGNGKK